jgi:hypothetical protein
MLEFKFTASNPAQLIADIITFSKVFGGDKKVETAQADMFEAPVGASIASPTLLQANPENVPSNPNTTEKRTRRTKAEIEAAKAAEEQTPVAAQTQQAATQAEPVTTTATPVATIAELSAALTDFVTRKNVPQGIALLGKYGAERISDIKPAHHAAFITDCQAV